MLNNEMADRASGIKAKLLAYTPVFPDRGLGVLSMELTYPRSIHAELMTHRNMSRNAASSRAIPFNVTVANLEQNTFYPIEYWGRSGPGMQAGEGAAIPAEEGDTLVREMRDFVIQKCRELSVRGVHKSIINRYLEPFSYITVVLTTHTGWWNDLLWQRRHKDAERHFDALAQRVNAVMNNLDFGKATGVDGAHFPYLDEGEGIGETWISKSMVSSARCARISYRNNSEGKPFSWTDDWDLGRRLREPTIPVVDWRWHPSPLEHIVYPARWAQDRGVMLDEVKALTTSIYGSLPVVTYRQVAETALIQRGLAQSLRF